MLKTRTFTIRLDRATLAALNALAAEAERTRGDYLRLLVRREARRRGLIGDPTGGGQPVGRRKSETGSANVGDGRATG